MRAAGERLHCIRARPHRYSFSPRVRRTRFERTLLSAAPVVTWLTSSTVPHADAVTADDARIWQHYSGELQQEAHPKAQLWLLLFRGAAMRQTPSKHALARWRSLGIPVCAWTERDVFTAFPRLPAAIQASKALNRTRRAHEAPYIAQYFWFHTSLGVWLRWHGEAHARARFFWRLEPDVLFAGSLGTLARWSEVTRTDVLLPNLVRTKVESFVHFTRDWERFSGIPPSRRAWSLVCVGRYSAAFLQLLERLWSHGCAERCRLRTLCSLQW